MNPIGTKGLYWLLGIVVVASLAIATYFQLVTTGTLGTNTETATSTDGLPPEPEFKLPGEATAIDEYAFIKPDGVYFRSLTDTEPLQIPNADQKSFERLSDLMTYETSDVVRDCGGGASYAYYGDNTQVYFYQIWRVPGHFRASRIEVVADTQKHDFTVTNNHTAYTREHQFSVGYRIASSTCRLQLSRTNL